MTNLMYLVSGCLQVSSAKIFALSVSTRPKRNRAERQDCQGLTLMRAPPDRESSVLSVCTCLEVSVVSLIGKAITVAPITPICHAWGFRNE